MELILLALMLYWGVQETKKDLKRRQRSRKDTSEPLDNLKRAEVPFGADEPKGWSTYIGQDKAKELLNLSLATLAHNLRPRLMFVAAKGVGKSAIARIYAKKFLESWEGACEAAGVPFEGKYIETTGAMLQNKDELDKVMSQVRLYDVLFIDEVHQLPRNVADTLLPALQENRYPFSWGMGDLPQVVCWLGATTDVGLLPEAFQDRFQLVPLEPMTVEDLRRIVQVQPTPVDNDAAQEIAQRSAGYPREVKRIFARAKEVSIVDRSTSIRMPHALKAFELLGLDKYGLYPQDRAVLHALFSNPKVMAPRRDGTIPIRYAQSERTIRTITGLDEGFFKAIESKLLRLGYLTISSSGRELTPKALNTYFEKT